MFVPSMTAQDLFRVAYESRYTWDQEFPGYTATVNYKFRKEAYIGHICVSSDLKPKVSNVVDNRVAEAIRGQLIEVVIHRVCHSFQEAHGKNSFSYGETDDTGAVEILIGSKAQGDRYKVRNNEVCMVHRHIQGNIVTIHTSSAYDTGEGYLSLL